MRQRLGVWARERPFASFHRLSGVEQAQRLDEGDPLAVFVFGAAKAGESCQQCGRIHDGDMRPAPGTVVTCPIRRVVRYEVGGYV